MSKFTDDNFEKSEDHEQYESEYNSIIESAKNRVALDAEIYTEIHHIIPKSLGGSNDSDNLVTLTYKEHIKVHFLLHKIYPNNFKILFALKMMLVKSKKSNRDALDEEELAILVEIREKAIKARKGRKMPEGFGKFIGECNSKRVWSEESKLKNSLSHKGKRPSEKAMQASRAACKGKPSWNKGIPMSEEAKAKLREARKHLSEEARQHYSESAKKRGFCGPTKKVEGPDGKVYKSTEECARAFNVSSGAIRNRIKKHPELGFKFVD